MLLDISCDYTDFEAALALQQEVEKKTGIRPAITRGASECEKDTDRIKINLIILYFFQYFDYSLQFFPDFQMLRTFLLT